MRVMSRHESRLLRSSILQGRTRCSCCGPRGLRSLQCVRQAALPAARLPPEPHPRHTAAHSSPKKAGSSCNGAGQVSYVVAVKEPHKLSA